MFIYWTCNCKTMQKTECYSRQEQRKIRNHDIMSAKEKNAAAKQTYSFPAPLTNEQPCVSRTKHNADKRGFISVMFICYHTYFLFIIFFFLIKRNRCSKLPVFFFHSCIMLSSCINVFMTKDITYKSYVTCVLI